jgi:hypothetical protein
MAKPMQPDLSKADRADEARGAAMDQAAADSSMRYFTKKARDEAKKQKRDKRTYKR